MPPWLVALALAAPGPTQPDLAEEAELLFRLGVRDYDEGRLEDALEHMLASLRLVPNRNVEFNVARCYEDLGMPEEAWRHYRAYARAEPDPAARVDAEAALARLEPAVATVEITSTPPGATVFLDRRDLGPRGRTPLALALRPGEHPILLELEGHEPAERSAILVKGRAAVVEVALAPLAVDPPEVAAPAPEPEPWEATLWAGGLVVVQVDAGRCELLPGRVSGAGRPVAPTLPAAAPPGSALLAQAPPRGVHLDVAGRGPTTRLALARADKRALHLLDASALRTWVFDRCAPTDPGGLAAAVAALPPPVRLDVVAVLAEWAAARSATGVEGAAAGCAAGECAALVGALVRP